MLLIIFTRRRQVEWVAGEAEKDNRATDIDLKWKSFFTFVKQNSRIEIDIFFATAAPKIIAPIVHTKCPAEPPTNTAKGFCENYDQVWKIPK